jgi:hypothetical protein
MIDLWPDNLGAGVGRAPAAILREQVRHLEKKTNNVITGRIEPSYLPRVTVREKFGADEDLFMYEFHLEVPILDYYRKNIITIFHGIDLYPIIIHTDEAIKKELSKNVSNITVYDEEEFLDILKRIFNSGKTVTIINSILAQVKEIVPTSIA